MPSCEPPAKSYTPKNNDLNDPQVELSDKQITCFVANRPDIFRDKTQTATLSATSQDRVAKASNAIGQGNEKEQPLKKETYNKLLAMQPLFNKGKEQKLNEPTPVPILPSEYNWNISPDFAVLDTDCNPIVNSDGRRVIDKVKVNNQWYGNAIAGNADPKDLICNFPYPLQDDGTGSKTYDRILTDTQNANFANNYPAGKLFSVKDLTGNVIFAGDEIKTGELGNVILDGQYINNTNAPLYRMAHKQNDARYDVYKTDHHLSDHPEYAILDEITKYSWQAQEFGHIPADLAVVMGINDEARHYKAPGEVDNLLNLQYDLAFNTETLKNEHKSDLNLYSTGDQSVSYEFEDVGILQQTSSVLILIYYLLSIVFLYIVGTQITKFDFRHILHLCTLVVFLLLYPFYIFLFEQFGVRAMRRLYEMIMGP